MKTYCSVQGFLRNALWWSTWEGYLKKSGYTYMYSWSLCCVAETNTTLRNDYTPIKINLNLKNESRYKDNRESLKAQYTKVTMQEFADLLWYTSRTFAWLQWEMHTWKHKEIIFFFFRGNENTGRDEGVMHIFKRLAKNCGFCVIRILNNNKQKFLICSFNILNYSFVATRANWTGRD